MARRSDGPLSWNTGWKAANCNRHPAQFTPSNTPFECRHCGFRCEKLDGGPSGCGGMALIMLVAAVLIGKTSLSRVLSADEGGRT